MNWLFRLLQMEKRAAFGDEIAVSFGVSNINSLQNMINQILANPVQDPSRVYWFNAIQNDPGTNLILQNNGQALLSAKVIQQSLANIQNLAPNLRAETNRLNGELNQRVQFREQQAQEQVGRRHAKSRKVTSFRMLNTSVNYITYALSWTSHIPEKERAFLFSGLDPNAKAYNPIRDAIQTRLGVELQRNQKLLPNEWLVVGLQSEHIPQLKQIFTEMEYDTSTIDATVNQLETGEALEGHTDKFLIRFDNVSATTDYHLSIDLKQFEGAHATNNLLPLFIDIVDKVFPQKGAVVKTQKQKENEEQKQLQLQQEQLQQEQFQQQQQQQPVQQFAQLNPAVAPAAAAPAGRPAWIAPPVVSDRSRELIAKKREQTLQSAGEYYMHTQIRDHVKVNSAIFIRGNFNIYQDFQKMLAMREFDTTDLINKTLMKGAELRNSDHVQVQRIINGVVDGYYTARANKQRNRDSITKQYLPDTEKFQAEVAEFLVQKSGQEPYRLAPLQGGGAQWLYSRQSALLGDETGGGKTEQLIVAAEMRTKNKNSWDDSWDEETGAFKTNKPVLASGKILVFTLASVVYQFAQRILQVNGLPDSDEFLQSPESPVKLRIEDMSQPNAKWLVLSYGKLNTLTKADQESKMGDTEEADDAIEMVLSEEEEGIDPKLNKKQREAQRQAQIEALMQQLRLQNFDVMILDESHMIKNSTANTSKNVATISKTIPFKWGASATVSANKPSDLHHQLLAVGSSMGSMTSRRFNKRYTGMKPREIRGQDGGEYLVDPSNAKQFLNFARQEYGGFDEFDLNSKLRMVENLSIEKLRPIVNDQIKSITDLHSMLILTDVYQRKTKKQVNPNMPEHFRNEERLTTDDNIRANLTEAVQARLANRKNPDKPITPLATLNAYRVEMALQKVDHSVNKAMQIIQQGKKVLIFTCFVEPARALESSLRAQLQPYGMEVAMAMGESTGSAMKSNSIEIFRDPNSPLKVFVLGVLSSGTGLDLPNIVEDVIVNDISWTPKDADQVEGRAFRINSKKDVTTHYMILEDTPDAVIYQTVQKKRDIAQRIQNIDEQYAEKVRKNKDTSQELALAQEEHWNLVREQLIAETTVQHYWAEQQRISTNRNRLVASRNWFQKTAYLAQV